MLYLITFRAYPMTDQILTLKEVAKYLKLTEKTAYRLAAEKKLPGFKVGGSWRFKSEDLEAWIEEQKDKE
jgi:excisionase family DNA binding protein